MGDIFHVLQRVMVPDTIEGGGSFPCPIFQEKFPTKTAMMIHKGKKICIDSSQCPGYIFKFKYQEILRYEKLL